MLCNCNALKNLAVKLGCAESVEQIQAETISEVIQFMDENAPFGVEMDKAEITWDGDTSGLEKVSFSDLPDSWYRVSDTVLTADKLIGNTMTYIEGDTTVSVELTEDNVKAKDNRVFIVVDGLNMIISTDGFSSEGVTFTAGTWFMNMSSYGVYTSGVTYSAEVVKTLDPKFVPAPTVFLANSDSDYIFKINEDTSQSPITLEELEKAVMSGPVLFIDFNGPRIPINIVCYPDEVDYGTVTFLIDGETVNKYTAEYQPK